MRSVDEILEPLGEITEMVVEVRHPVAELEDDLHARQVDSKVALIARDRPDPAHLGRLVPLDAAPTDATDQAQFLVSDEDLR